jgi:hypothetical protein
MKRIFKKKKNARKDSIEKNEIESRSNVKNKKRPPKVKYKKQFYNDIYEEE